MPYAIGYDGEQNARTVTINVKGLMERWPGALPQLMVTRPGETQAYIATTELDNVNGVLTWIVNGYDTQIVGTGQAQIVLTNAESENTIIAKSDVTNVYVKQSIDGTNQADIPEPYETWLATVLGYTTRAEAAEIAAVNAETSAIAAKEAAEGYAESAEAARDEAVSAKDRAVTAETNAESALTGARSAQTAAESAQVAAELAQVAAAQSEQNAAASESAAFQSAANSEQSAQNSAYYADRAEQIANTNGYMDIYIDERGHLIYTRTNAVDVDFRLSNGHLLMEVI